MTRVRCGDDGAGGGELHQLEHEVATAQVHGLHPDRLGERDELRHHPVGRGELVPPLEAEHRLVEARRPLAIGDAQPHMVDHRAHRSPFRSPVPARLRAETMLS